VRGAPFLSPPLQQTPSRSLLSLHAQHSASTPIY
jgi:hypothetical protein